MSTSNAIILVHGMGNHTKGWSQPTQDLLASRLPVVGLEPTFIEVVYSDLIEGKISPQSLGHADASEERQYFVYVAKLEAAMDILNANEPIGKIEPAGKTVDDFRTLYHYVVGYLTSAKLRDQIHSRIYESFAEARRGAETGGRIVIVGHSLGSVISWNMAVDQNSVIGSGLDKLVTLGSPLGWLAQAGIVRATEIVPCSWACVSAPDDIVSRAEIKAPPFNSKQGFVSLKTRRVPSNPHSSLLSDEGIVNDWALLLV